MKVMIRQTQKGLEAYVPKKDLEEMIVETERTPLWGGWARLANGLVLEMPALAADTALPITVEARVRREAAE
ncbi:MAG: putative nitrogen fixation protein NifT [Mangrovicoccus sp.]|nr:putative nitrogen fixation protein NifT [Mangrovicoccus sp.]